MRKIPLILGMIGLVLVVTAYHGGFVGWATQ